jgi:hypothetical protein
MPGYRRTSLHGDKENFISEWLMADPSDLRSARSAELDMALLLETLLEALAEEERGVEDGKVVRLKNRTV